MAENLLPLNVSNYESVWDACRQTEDFKNITFHVIQEHYYLNTFEGLRFETICQLCMSDNSPKSALTKYIKLIAIEKLLINIWLIDVSKFSKRTC